MSRQGYHLLTTEIMNSDQDDEDDEKVLFEKRDGDGWSEGEENLNILVDTSENNGDSSKNKEAIELRSRNSAGGGGKSMDEIFSGASSSTPRNGSRANNSNGVLLLDRRVRKDDTLQKISLQFSVSIAELKRVNGFLADSDLFAREIIKIPVQKYGYNHALIMAELDGDISSSPFVENNASPQFASSALSSSNANEAASHSTISVSTTDPVQAERLLQNVDANVLKAQRQLEQRQQQSRDVFNADNGFDDDDLLNSSFRNSRNTSQQHWLERSVRHFLVLVLIIFVFVGMPVIYLMYKFSESHGYNGNNGSHGHY